MDDLIKKATANNKTVKIFADSFAENPREWDNLSKMIFFGKHAHLGDKHEVKLEGSFNSRAEFMNSGKEIVSKQFKDVVIVKAVHLYEHSGTGISTSFKYPFNCEWDSGTVGFAIVTKQDIRNNFGVKRVTQELIDKADKILEAEVETLNQYVSGEVYSFVIEDETGEVIDSCGGFYGSDITTNGMSDHMDAELITELEKD